MGWDSMGKNPNPFHFRESQESKPPGTQTINVTIGCLNLQPSTFSLPKSSKASISLFTTIEVHQYVDQRQLGSKQPFVGLDPNKKHTMTGLRLVFLKKPPPQRLGFVSGN